MASTFFELKVIGARNFNYGLYRGLEVGELIKVIYIAFHSFVSGVRALGCLTRYNVLAIGVQDILIRGRRLQTY